MDPSKDNKSVNGRNNNTTKVLIGVGIGTALGVGYALSRRKKDAWSTARQLTKKMAANSGDLADTGGRILERVRVIYDEARKVAEDAAQLWTHGRKMVGY